MHLCENAHCTPITISFYQYPEYLTSLTIELFLGHFVVLSRFLPPAALNTILCCVQMFTRFAPENC